MSLASPSSGDKQFWLVCNQIYIKMTSLLKFVFLYFIVRLRRAMFTMLKIRNKCLQRKLCMSVEDFSLLQVCINFNCSVLLALFVSTLMVKKAQYYPQLCQVI